MTPIKCFKCEKGIFTIFYDEDRKDGILQIQCVNCSQLGAISFQIDPLKQD